MKLKTARKKFESVLWRTTVRCMSTDIKVRYCWKRDNYPEKGKLPGGHIKRVTQCIETEKNDNRQKTIL